MNLKQHLKAEFDQESAIHFTNVLSRNKYANSEAMSGVCQELCWKWLKRLKSKALLYPTPQARMDAFMEKQQTLVKAIERHNDQAIHLYRYPFEYYGFMRAEVDTLELNKSKTYAKWQSSGGGLYITFEMRNKTTSHALAAYKHPSYGDIGWQRRPAYAFDPNYGEFEIMPADIHLWIRTLLREKYGQPENKVNNLWHLKP